ncbi:MAG: sodium:proton antiporter [Lachnospiraceae bacterium]|nr:sodium:proton antiporter [Lachnospiraceae bacterium]
MMTVEQAYQYLYFAALIALAVLIGVMIVRSFIGPRILDRVLSINMIGTLVITSLAITSRLLDESYLTDIALIYAMVSLLSVLVLSAIYLPKDPSESDSDGNVPADAAAAEKTGKLQTDGGVRGTPGTKARKRRSRHRKTGAGSKEIHLTSKGEEDVR